MKIYSTKYIFSDGITQHDAEIEDGMAIVRMDSGLAEQFDSLMTEMLEENDRLRKLYDELIIEVATKHPGESRHETALRYIRNAERRESHCEAQSA